jgi:predicted RND superfamily exporter protein
MDRLGVFVLNHPRALMAGFAIVVAVAVIGFSNFEVSFDIRKSMGLEVPYVKRLDYVSHSAVGSMYSYNLVVAFPEDRMALEPENMEKFDHLIKEAEAYRLTKRTKSVVEIIKDMYQALNAGDPAFYRIPETRQMIAQILLLYENAGGKEAEKWMDYDYRRLRMEVDLEDYNSLEAKRELVQLENKAKAVFPDTDVSLAGSVAQFTIMQDVLSRGQIVSFLVALAVIGVMMMVVFGSIRTGLIAMIPNITPALVAGGLMGWTDVPLDMMTITIMPMLLGLAVDDTIHFINHAKLEFERTGSYHTSLRRTFAAIGIPLLFTTLIITANFSVYMTSAAKVYVNMGLVTGVGLVSALLADYLVTPVLLVRTRAFSESTPRKKNESVWVPRAETRN